MNAKSDLEQQAHELADLNRDGKVSRGELALVYGAIVPFAIFGFWKLGELIARVVELCGG